LLFLVLQLSSLSVDWEPRQRIGQHWGEAMIWTSTISILLFLFGALIGIYLPAVVLYSVTIWRSSSSWQSGMWKLTRTLLVALIGFFVLYALISHFAVALLGPKPTTTIELLGFFVLGGMVGLMGGSWITWRAIKRSKRRSESLQHTAGIAAGEGNSR
jgi:hypothetical protein